MDTSSFRQQVQEALRSQYLARLADYLERVDSEGSIEDRRKAVELTAKLADAFPDKDQGRLLPMVNITIGGRALAESTPLQVQEAIDVTVKELDSILDSHSGEMLQASAAQREHLAVNLDVEPLLVEQAR